MAEVMRMLSSVMVGSVGSRALSSSRSVMSDFPKFGRPRIKLFLYPEGMLCLEAVHKLSLKIFLPLVQDVGGGSREKRSSVSLTKPAQSASLKLVKEWRALGGELSER
jgi:hypothetical protein